MKTYLIHMAQGDPRIKFRAYFEKGGYRDCDGLLEAQTATSPNRGPVVRIERVRIDLVWTREHPKETS